MKKNIIFIFFKQLHSFKTLVYVPFSRDQSYDTLLIILYCSIQLSRRHFLLVSSLLRYRNLPSSFTLGSVQICAIAKLKRLWRGMQNIRCGKLRYSDCIYVMLVLVYGTTKLLTLSLRWEIDIKTTLNRCTEGNIVWILLS